MRVENVFYNPPNPPFDARSKMVDNSNYLFILLFKWKISENIWLYFSGW